MDIDNNNRIAEKIWKFIYSPTDALASRLRNIKIHIKIYIKTAPTCFGVTVTQYIVQHTHINKGLIYAATPPPY